MVNVIVVGGGWSGCAAAIAAAKAGASVTILERTDLLLGTGLVGGIFRNNGRYTAAEEAIAMGGGDLFVAMDANSRHRGINFPGHSHASLYDVTTMEPLVRKVLANYGVDMRFRARFSGAVRYGRMLQALVLDSGETLPGDVFVDATGSAGPMGNCMKYGNGCSMCILRCPSFGPRVSITSKCDVREILGCRADGSYGAMSGSCKLNKDSLAPEIRNKLDTEGAVVIPLPDRLIKKNGLGKKACSQYAIDDYAANIVLLDTGHAKLMTPFMPVEEVRAVPGLEQARYEDPYAGGIGNSIRFLGAAPCGASLKVEGVENLFACGEKAGVFVGHTEAVITGLLAGNNAVRHCLDMAYLTLPDSLASGDIISFVQRQMESQEGLKMRYTFSGSVYFERMKEKGIYSTDRNDIRSRVAVAGLTDVYNKCLV